MFKDHIQRLKFKMGAMEVQRLEREALLKAKDEILEDQQDTIERNALLLEGIRTQLTNAQGEKAVLLEGIRTPGNNAVLLQTVQAQLAGLEADYAGVQVALINSQNVTDEKQEACDAFAAEVQELRENSELLLTQTAALKQEKRTRKKKEDTAKCSVLRSFQWREQNVDAVVLRGAVAFWAATENPGEVDDEEAKRTSSKVRKQILKVIVAQGFNGELQDELEKDFMKRKRFKVFALSKKSDLESKFNGEAIGSMAHCEPEREKHARGLIPSSTTVGNFQRKINRRAAALGLSFMPQGNSWCWGDSTGDMKEAVHRYIKSTYYDKWDTRVTEDDPYIVVLTGDLARVSLKKKCVTLCGAKECDRRLTSQKQTVGHRNNMNQSRNLYVPAMAGYVKESDIMPRFQQLVDLFVEVEQQKFIIVDNKRYDNVFIKVLVVADMMFLHKFTGRGGGCATSIHFCMMCSCISKFRNEGEPGGCDACRRDNKVYDTNGLPICIHHDVLTPEKRARQKQRQAQLEGILRGKQPPRKKPLWEDLAGLQLACIERCVPGHTNLDGRLAYNPADLNKFPTMTIAQCNAWLDARCEGIHFATTTSHSH